MRNKRYLIGIYTSIAKSYCDQQFFDRINQLPESECDIAIVDNSNDKDYVNRLIELCPRAETLHINLDAEPKETLFLRKVERSANLIRSFFLHHEYRRLIIIESDVIVPENLIDLFDEARQKLSGEIWGIIGGLYYKQLHKHLETDNVELEAILDPNRVFSGCTLYNRSLINTTKFRFTDDYRVFPDSHMSYDSVHSGFPVYHYNKIKCDHIEKNIEGKFSGWRGRECLND